MLPLVLAASTKTKTLDFIDKTTISTRKKLRINQSIIRATALTADGCTASSPSPADQRNPGSVRAAIDLVPGSGP